jgi:aminopeptidase N
MAQFRRLYDDFQPTRYDLSMVLEREKRTFRGTVGITGNLNTEGSVRLHAKDLDIQSATINGHEASVSRGDNDELELSLDGLEAGSIQVTIAYSGAITDPMHGIYPCYFTVDGIKKELLATQFESHHARETFPCIDEPEAKSIYDVTLTTETGLSVLGNMPVKSQDEQDGRLVTTFEQTPRMSSYLLAFVAGDLHRKTAQTNSGVEVNVWATPAQPAASLDFALDIATRTIDDYFGIPYPLPKSDHVALPDFSAGAMENWGLITYREMALLADPATISVSSKHYIATVVAHELSHQWFGNLVTMKWWDDLWLNESFANYMEYMAIDALEPSWNVWLDFATSDAIFAQRRDSLDGVQAVHMAVTDPEEINTLFDGAIVYAKGARLLQMLGTYIEAGFQEGLKQYFKTYAYGNTVGQNLWDKFGEASGKDIAAFMNTWISQPGYPVLHVTQNGDQVTLRQEQFLVGPHAASTRLWPIPLGSTCSEMPEMLTEGTVTVPRTHDTPLRFNQDNSAHFITHYDDGLFDRLIAELEAGSLPELARIQLLNETIMLTRAGLTPSVNLIPLIEAYAGETSEPVWDIISLGLGELKKFVENDEAAEDKLRALTARLAKDQYKRLGWDARVGEDETDTKLRPLIIGLMLYGRDKDALSHALSLYAPDKLIDMNPELRSLVLTTAVRENNDRATFEELIGRYRDTASPEIQGDIAAAITSAKDSSLIGLILEYIMDASIIRPQDVGHWFVYTLRNRHGRTLAWNWLRDNWAWIEKTFKTDKSYDYYPRYIASSLVTRKELQQYRSFFAPLKADPGLTRVITVGDSELEARVELIERDAPAVIDALHRL